MFRKSIKRFPSFLIIFSMVFIFAMVTNAQEWTQHTVPYGNLRNLAWNPHDTLEVIGFDIDEPIAYRSIDGGRSFEVMTEGLPPMSHDRASLWYNPRSADTLIYNNFSGLYLSIDGGDHWMNRTPPNVTPITSWAAVDISRSNPNHIIFLRNTAPWSWMITDDAGANWSTMTTPDLILPLKIDPFNSERMIGIQRNILYRSLDSGQNWEPYPVDFSEYTSGYPVEIQYDPVRPNTFYTLLSSGMNQNFLFRIIDEEDGEVTQIGGCRTFNVSPSGILSASVQSENQYGLEDLYISADAGDSWTQIAEWMPYAGSYDGTPTRFAEIQFNPLNSNSAFIGCGRYAFHTSDGGLQPDHVVKGIDFAVPGEVYPREEGLLLRTISGQLWPLDMEQEPEWPLLWNFVEDVSFATPDNDTIYAAGYGVESTFDAGENFQQTWPSPFVGSSTSVVVMHDAPTPVLAWRGSHLFARYSHEGDWIQLNQTGLPISTTPPGDLYADPFHPGRLYTCVGELYRSTDYGHFWQSTSIQFDQRIIQYQAIPLSNNMYILDGVGTLYFYDRIMNEAQVLPFPEDAGTPLSFGLRPGTSTHLMVGTTEGVFESHDGGIQWDLLEGGYIAPVTAIAFTLDGAGLYVGTKDDGLFFGNNLFDTSVGEHTTNLPTSITLYPAYPNPFNASTRIGFDLPQASGVRVAVYDLLGREVAMLLNGVKPAGHHEVSWNATSSGGVPVSSGTYLLHLEGNGENKIQKMMLIK